MQCRHYSVAPPVYLRRFSGPASPQIHHGSWQMNGHHEVHGCLSARTISSSKTDKTSDHKFPENFQMLDLSSGMYWCLSIPKFLEKLKQLLTFQQPLLRVLLYDSKECWKVSTCFHSTRNLGISKVSATWKLITKLKFQRLSYGRGSLEGRRTPRV